MVRSPASRLRLRACALALPFACLLAGAPSAHEQDFRVSIRVLEPLAEDPASFANDINRRGEVLGSSYSEDAQANTTSGQPVFWRPSGPVRLPVPEGATYGWAFGNNNRGQRVGEAGVLGGPIQAVIWKRGRPEYLPSLADTGNGYASDINDRGEIAGGSTTADGHERAVVWRRERIKELGVPEGATETSSLTVNERGQVVGSSFSRDTDGKVVGRRGVLWTRDAPQVLPLIPGGTESTTHFINNRGVVVGWVRDGDGRLHATTWKRGEVQDLGIPAGAVESTADAINDRGWIIGTVRVSETSFRTVLWERGELVDLSSLIPSESGWSNLLPYVLNNSGQLVGGGTLNGRPRAFLMTIKHRRRRGR